MRLTVNQVQRGNFKVIEYELLHYHENKKIYQHHENEILHSSPLAQEIRSTDIKKPTEIKALQLLSNNHMVEMKRRLDAVEYALSHVDTIRQQLIAEKYFVMDLTDAGIMDKLHIERATYYRYRRDVIELIADRLGWII
jgi:RinA family phage transcriptional activator